MPGLTIGHTRTCLTGVGQPCDCGAVVRTPTDRSTTVSDLTVRAIKPHGGSAYFRFPGSVGEERAIELARLHASAQCIPVAYFEVRPDIYPRLNMAPSFVAAA